MKLKLNLNGSVDPFANYLKNYFKIRESLLLEIDTTNRAFVAKATTEDRSSVRFSSISFNDANITVVSDEGEEKREAARIKVGILCQLRKFIQMVERLGSDCDENGNANFNIEIDYDFLTQPDNSVDYVATSVSFKSSKLKMRMDGFRIKEFVYLSDETFKNVVFNVHNPISLEISAATINSIIKTSEIVKVDSKKDALVFYADEHKLYVKDRGMSTKQEPNFEYLIGEFVGDPDYEINIPITRDRFLKMFDKTDESFNIIIGKSEENNPLSVNRVLFDSTNSTTKIAIAAMRDC